MRYVWPLRGAPLCTLLRASAEAERPAAVSALANAFATHTLPWTWMTA